MNLPFIIHHASKHRQINDKSDHGTEPIQPRGNISQLATETLLQIFKYLRPRAAVCLGLTTTRHYGILKTLSPETQPDSPPSHNRLQNQTQAPARATPASPRLDGAAFPIQGSLLRAKVLHQEGAGEQGDEDGEEQESEGEMMEGGEEAFQELGGLEEIR